jgi:3-isopropylmalate/(R)-2-methylmalate dehydratase large subunit
MASGEVSMSTATNNNTGRFGPTNARLFLGSPGTVAASAICGKITDPRRAHQDEAIQRLTENCYA